VGIVSHFSSGDINREGREKGLIKIKVSRSLEQCSQKTSDNQGAEDMALGWPGGKGSEVV